MTAGQRRIRDLIGIALFVLLLAFLFWPSDDDEPDSDSSPDGVAQQETPTAVPTEEAEPVSDITCDPDDSVVLLKSWVSAMNSGDRDSLETMLPEAGAPSPVTTTYPSMDQQILHSFTVHESGSMTEPAVVLEYLETRQSEFDERWRLEDVEVQRLDRSEAADGPELDQLTAVLQRSASDLPDHEISGEVIINCHDELILMVDLATELPELALPIDVDDFLAAVGPYGTGEMRDLRMLVSTDLRHDRGSLMEWELRRIEANSMSGSYVENVRVRTTDGHRILQYVYDGARWYLDHRGWREVGNVTGWNTLPLEIMLTRREPSMTANILRDHLDDIPEEGRATFTGEFEPRDELRQVATTSSQAESINGVIEVVVEDGNIVRTRYRLQDPESDWEAIAREIQWLHIRRLDRYDPEAFTRPDDFTRDEQQFHPSPEIAEQMELQDRLDHMDGIGERYSLDWEGRPLELLVTPSRGLANEHSQGDDWPLDWEIEREVVDDLTVILAGPEQQVFPLRVLWDTGWYRYELQVDPGTLDDPDWWDMSVIREVVESLVPARPGARRGDLDTVGD